MEIFRATLDTCASATGLVVVIDVLRAFTTAAYCFHAGAREILLVSQVQEAFGLKKKFHDCFLMGEVEGLPIPGFDYGNSPAEILGRDFTGRRAIQRTSAGTRGVLLASNADLMLTASLTNTSATARRIECLMPEKVTLIPTGVEQDADWGDEDAACADMIEDLLRGRTPDLKRIEERVRLSRSGLKFRGDHPSFSPMDLNLALRIDCFHFCMAVERKDRLHFLRRVDD